MRAPSDSAAEDNARRAAQKVQQLADELLAPVRADLQTIAEAVAREFQLPEADTLIAKPRGRHALTEPRSATVLLALEFLPLHVETLAPLFGGSQALIYGRNATARRLIRQPEFAARVERLRSELRGLLKGPRRTKPRKERKPHVE